MPQPDLIPDLKTVLSKIIDLADSDEQVSSEVDEISELAVKTLEFLEKDLIAFTTYGPIRLSNMRIVDPNERFIPGD
jgi:hypothetical protein